MSDIKFVPFSCRRIDESDPYRKLEYCARVCYKSEGKIQEGSAEKLLKAVISRGHESVLEHFRIKVENRSLTAYQIRNIKFIDVDEFVDATGRKQNFVGNVRAWRDEIRQNPLLGELASSLAYYYPGLFGDLVQTAYGHEQIKIGRARDYVTVLLTTNVRVTHEFVRHRSLSFSQESTRYCNYGGSFTYIRPTEFGWDSSTMEVWEKQIREEAAAYSKLLELTKKPEQASAVLSKSLKADIVISGTFKQWDDFMKLRLAPDAHPEARKCAQLIHDEIMKE